LSRSEFYLSRTKKYSQPIIHDQILYRIKRQGSHARPCGHRVERPPIIKRLLDLLINCMSLIELVQQNRFHYWER